MGVLVGFDAVASVAPQERDGRRRSVHGTLADHTLTGEPPRALFIKANVKIQYKMQSTIIKKRQKPTSLQPQP
jgi:hypothetical protein